MADPITSAQRFFNVPNTYSSTSDFFPESQTDSAWRNQLEGNPQTPQAGDEFDNTDWNVASKTADPFQVFELAGKLRQDAQANKVIAGFSKINPRMPDYLDRYDKLISSNPYALNDPRVTQISRTNSTRAALSQANPPNLKNDQAVRLAQLGMAPDDIRAMMKDGKLDPLDAEFHIGNLTRQQAQDKLTQKPVKSDALLPTSKQKEDLFDMVDKFQTDPTDDEAIAAYNKKNKASLGGWLGASPTDEQKQQGMALAKQDKMAALQGLVTKLHNSGIRVPKAVDAAANLPTENEKAVLAAPTDIPSFKTADEVPANLPKGTIVIVNGRKARID